MALRCGCQPNAVISDRQSDAVFRGLEPKLNTVCMRMLNDVVERFLGDAVERFFMLNLLRAIALALDLDQEPVAGNVARMTLDCLYQPFLSNMVDPALRHGAQRACFGTKGYRELGWA